MVTKFSPLIILLCFFIMACNKIETVDSSLMQGTILANGSFKSGAHTTSGMAKIVKTSDNKLFLQLENFSTDAGPDLRIYLSPSIDAKTFIEVAPSVKNGSYEISLPANTDYNTNKFVLIWCKSFSVLFGSAQLQ